MTTTTEQSFADLLATVTTEPGTLSRCYQMFWKGTIYLTPLAI